MAWERFEEVKTSDSYFKKANEIWRGIEKLFKNRKFTELNHSIAEVVSQCQLSIDADHSNGNAFVLLAEALQLAAISGQNGPGDNRYKYLTSHAAAVINYWHKSKLVEYPFTLSKNRENGNRIYKSLYDIISAEYQTSGEETENILSLLTTNLIKDSISPSNLSELMYVIMNDLDYIERLNYPEAETHFLEETLPPAQYQYLQKTVYKMDNETRKQEEKMSPGVLHLEKLMDEFNESNLLEPLHENLIHNLKRAGDNNKWREALGWHAIITIHLDKLIKKRRNEFPESAKEVEKLLSNIAQFLGPIINEARKSNDVDTIILAIGYLQYLGNNYDICKEMSQELLKRTNRPYLIELIERIKQKPLFIIEKTLVEQAEDFFAYDI